MKKLFILTIIIAFVCSCEKTTDTSSDTGLPSNAVFCWECLTTQISTVSPSLSGYPQTATSKISKCGLTQAQADEVEQSMSSTTTATQSGYKVTIKSTCVCTKK